MKKHYKTGRLVVTLPIHCIQWISSNKISASQILRELIEDTIESQKAENIKCIGVPNYSGVN